MTQTPYINNMYFVKTRGKRKIKARVRKFTAICIIGYIVLIALKIYMAASDDQNRTKEFFIQGISTIPLICCEVFFMILGTLKRFIKTNYLFF